MEIEWREFRGQVLHDFPYGLKNRKCPHYALVSVTASGSCVHGCPMCYARVYPWSIDNRIVIYKNLPGKIDEELKRAKIMFPLYLSQVSDVLQPVAEVREITYEIIRIILRHNVSFHIVTKNAEGALELIDRIPELAGYPYWYLAMTIESAPEKQKITSPFASTIKNRLDVLKTLHKRGIAVSARIDPCILGLTSKEEILWLIEKINQSGVKHIVSSTGFFNKISIIRLLEAIKESEFNSLASGVAEIYGFCEKEVVSYGAKKRFWVPIELRKNYHCWLRTEIESRSMTYAICLELPKVYDSPGLAHCEGCSGSYVHIKKDGIFFPVDKCFGDCLRSCPDVNKPPCRKPILITQYPYTPGTLFTDKLRIKRSIQDSLF
jgi:DNA repair photolyase